MERMSQLGPHAPSLWVGSMPSGPEDLARLVQAGVGAVLSLQTDDDLGERGLRWTTLWQLMSARGLLAERAPIRDFDKKDLLRGIDPALERLDALLASGRPVYLHCTAGLNRSPTVAIAHLTRTLGLAEAHTAVMAAHVDAVPYLDVLIKWDKAQRKRR